MFQLLIITVLAILSNIAYRKRFTSKRYVAKLHIVQLFYLFLGISASMLAISLGWEITRRTEVTIIPISTDILFLTYVLFVLLAFSAISIHSTSATLSDLFVHNEKHEEKVYLINEFFHGPFSHILMFFGSILATTLLMLLELNHPFTRIPEIYLSVCVMCGIIWGMVEGMGVMFSYYSRYTKEILSLSLIIAIILVVIGKLIGLDPMLYPFSTLVITNLVTLTFLLLISLLFFNSTGRRKRLYRKLFPKDYPFDG